MQFIRRTHGLVQRQKTTRWFYKHHTKGQERNRGGEAIDKKGLTPKKIQDNIYRLLKQH